MHFNPHQHVEYRFVSAMKHDMVLDATGNNKLVLYHWHKGQNQRWKIQQVQNGRYLIVNCQNNRALQVPNGSQNNGVQIEAHHSQKQQHQLWELVPCNDPEYFGKHAFYLRSFCGRALDVCEGKAQNDQQIIQWDYNGNKNQIWFVQPVSFVPQQNVHYKVVSGLNNHMVLDASQNPNDMNNLILYEWGHGPNQKWNIYHFNGKYFLINAKNNHAMQVHNGKHENGARIHVHHHNKHNHEMWELVPCHHPDFQNRHAFYIKSHSGKFLDVQGGQCKNEQHIIQWDYNGNKNQIWILEKA